MQRYEIMNNMASKPLSCEISDMIVTKLRASDFAHQINFGSVDADVPVFLSGSTYKLLKVDAFHRLGRDRQAGFVAVRGSDEVAILASPNEKNCVLKVGDVELDMKTSKSLVVTKNRDYKSPLGTIHFDSEDDLFLCFRQSLRSEDVHAPATTLKPILFAAGNTSTIGSSPLSGAAIGSKFSNLIGVYAEQVLRLQVLFSSEAGGPRSTIIDSVTVVDLPGSDGRSGYTTVTCKFHAVSGRCFCRSRGHPIRKPASNAALRMRFCGGPVGQSGRCQTCGKVSETKRCLAGFVAPWLTCKHGDGGGGSRVVIPNCTFLKLFLVACVDMRHSEDAETYLQWYEKLESALDETITRVFSECEKTSAQMRVHDEWNEAMLSDGSFLFDKKRKSLMRVGSKIKKWHKQASIGYTHLFREK